MIYYGIDYLIYSFVWWGFLATTVISAGYHRYFSHRSFSAPVWFEYMTLVLGPLSGSGHCLGWVGAHRMHHKHSDTFLDPHSPKYIGIFKTLTSTWKLKKIPRRYIKDLLKNKRVMWFYKNHTFIRTVTIFISWLFIGIDNWFWFIIMPMVWGYIGFGLLNTLCHRNGKVCNSILVNIFTMGEGWHINHHENSSDWKIGKKWWQWDPAAWFIRLIKKS